MPFANGATGTYKNAIPTPSQQGTSTPGRASFTDGFPPDTFVAVSAGGIPPYGGDFNGLFNQITGGLQYLQAGFIPGYDATFSASIGGYAKGAVIPSATFGNSWLSTADSNTSDPDTGGANWAPITQPAWDNVMWLDTGAANSLAVAMVPACGAYFNGMIVRLRAGNTNTAAASLSVNGLAAAGILQGGNGLTGGELVANWPYVLVYDSGSFHILGSGAGPVNVGAAKSGSHAVALNQFSQYGGQNGTGTGTATATETFTTIQKCLILVDANAGSTEGITGLAISVSNATPFANSSNWANAGADIASLAAGTNASIANAGQSVTITATANSPGNMTVGFRFFCIPLA